MTDEEQIRAVVAERVTAMRERDAERFVAQYAPQIVKFDLAPPLAHAGQKPATPRRCGPGSPATPAGRARPAALTGTIAGQPLTIDASLRT